MGDPIIIPQKNGSEIAKMTCAPVVVAPGQTCLLPQEKGQGKQATTCQVKEVGLGSPQTLFTLPVMETCSKTDFWVGHTKSIHFLC